MDGDGFDQQYGMGVSKEPLKMRINHSGWMDEWMD
jgi:hypothetical protein